MVAINWVNSVKLQRWTIPSQVIKVQVLWKV